MSALRDGIALYLAAPIMRATGFRFSKDYRHGATRFHRVVYACINVVRANLKAEGFPTYPAGKNGMQQ